MSEVKQRTCVVIIGMHRSGTSALAGMLDVIGVFPGKNLLEASTSNKKGYFENSKVYELNKEILESVHSSWDDYSFDFSQIKKSKKSKFIKKAKIIIENDYKFFETFLIKDPRVSILFPIWEKALEELNIIIKPIFIVRNPIEVALSLGRRNDFSIEKGLMLWAHYSLQSLLFSNVNEIHNLNYDDLLYDTEASITHIEKYLKLTIKEEIKKDACDFLDKDIKNNRINQVEIEKAPKVFSDLYKVLITRNYDESKLIGLSTDFKKLNGFVNSLTNINFLKTIEEGKLIEAKLNSRLNKCNKRKNILKVEVNFYEEKVDGISKAIMKCTDKKALAQMSFPYENKVDVIIPVFNAIDYLRDCLDSILSSDVSLINKIIVVNDGSLEETSNYLREVTLKEPLIDLIENSENLGYTKTVNIGLTQSKSSFVVLLNSDTTVSQKWLYGLVRCAVSQEKIGIVGPLSNAASWQSVPELFDEKINFKINELPDNLTVNEFASMVSSNSLRCYPKVSVVNGFCFLITRELINEIGIMDEANFPVGYGEENDYCIRAKSAGYSLAIADDVYVFHAKSKSFGHSSRKELSAKGSLALNEKHGDIALKELVQQIKNEPTLKACRKRITKAIEFSQLKDNIPAKNIKIIFILPSPGNGGGSHSIVQEVEAMRKMGIDAIIGIESRHINTVNSRYKDIPNVEELFVGYDENTLVSIAKNYDIAVATIFYSVELIKKITDLYPHILPAYYVQDYEPMFFTNADERKELARSSYGLLEDMLLFSKTFWIARQVALLEGVAVQKVSPSIDHDTYYPSLDSIKNLPVRIVAMIRPQTPYRGAERTMRTLSKIKKVFKENIDIQIFGSDLTSPGFSELEQNFKYTNLEVLDRPAVASCLQNADIFVDLSDYQAFGRTSLEAMACGCAVMLPCHGGGDEYAVDNYNALVVDTFDEEECFTRLSTLISDKPLLEEMKTAGIETAGGYSSKKAALSELNLFSEFLSVHRIKYPKKDKVTVSIVPVRRDDLEPVGSAYVRLIQPYFYNTGLKKKWDFVVTEPNMLPSFMDSDIAILQRNAAGIDKDKIINWLLSWKTKGKKCILEIDDDLFNEQGLLDRTSKTKKEVSNLVEMMRWLASSVDAVIVSTPLLSQLVSKYNKNVFLVQNNIDSKLWEIKSKIPPKKFLANSRKKTVKIGYIGTPTHDSDLLIVKSAIKRIENEYGNKVEVEVIGAFQKSLSTPLFGKAIGLPKNTTYVKFVEWLKLRVDWDIAIIPLADDEFNRSKSHLKFLDCTALGLVSICSNVPAYNFIVSNNVNGLLVDNTEADWYRAIKTLIDDPKLRHQLLKNAYKNLYYNYTVSSNISSYQEVLGKVNDLPLSTHNFLPASFKKNTTGDERRKKLIIKLKSNPYGFFADSKNKYIRPLKIFFKR